jgi:hypothetical protein
VLATVVGILAFVFLPVFILIPPFDPLLSSRFGAATFVDHLMEPRLFLLIGISPRSSSRNRATLLAVPIVVEDVEESLSANKYQFTCSYIALRFFL